MTEAYDRMRKRGYMIGNVDVTLICQKPRVNVCLPHPCACVSDHLFDAFA